MNHPVSSTSFSLNDPRTLIQLRWPILFLQAGLVIISFLGELVSYQQFALSLLALIPAFVFTHFFTAHGNTPKWNIIPLGLDLLVTFFLLFINGGATNPVYLILLLYIFLAPFYLSKEVSLLYALLAISAFFILPLSPFTFAPLPYKFFEDFNFPFIPLLTAGLSFWLFSTWLVDETTILNKNLQKLTHLTNRIDRFRSLGLLTAGICHELGTPLNTIRLRLGQIKKKGGFSQELLKDLEVLERNTDKCVNAIKKLNSQVHTESEKFFTGRSAIMVPLINSMAQYNHHTGLNISLSEDSLLPESMTTIPMPEIIYSRLLLDLFDNSREAGATDIEIKITDSENDISFDFQDNGSGFSKEILKHIGTPFVSSKNRGSGLGLYQLKNAIEFSGGQFKILPCLKGALIHLSFPKGELP